MKITLPFLLVYLFFSGNRALRSKSNCISDQKLTRPFLVAEIGNFLSGINVDILGALDAKYLPEADQALLAAIKKAATLNRVKLLQIKGSINGNNENTNNLKRNTIRGFYSFR